MPLTKFVDALPIPPVLKPTKTRQGVAQYKVKMKEVHQKLHRDLPPTKVWGYDGLYPGPTIVTNRNDKIRIEWENELPAVHLLPLDTTIHGASKDVPQVRTVVHLHGAKVAADSDGYPDAWFSRHYKTVGSAFKQKVYEYTNHQPATTLWYHDHALGITRLNVYAGLAGFYIIHDKQEQSLNLPNGTYDIPLLIQDRTFNADGSLFYPSQPQNPTPEMPNPSIVPGFFGDTILVNGMVWPYLEVEPRKYRFRLLNGSNSRIYNMSLTADTAEGFAPLWVQIGTDGGLLRRPVRLYQLTMAPAERAEVIIDFTEFAGQTIRLTNSQTPYDPETTGNIMQFRVLPKLSKPDTSSIPNLLSTNIPYFDQATAKERSMFFKVDEDSYGRPQFMLNGMMWDDPVTEKPVLGSTEVWNIFNAGTGIHPVHLHLVQFQIISRQPFDTDLFNSSMEVNLTGPPIPPDANEIGWKDTVRTLPGHITKIMMRFTDYNGSYVWHCHILEHEDYDMMRPLEVVDSTQNRTEVSKIGEAEAAKQENSNPSNSDPRLMNHNTDEHSPNALKANEHGTDNQKVSEHEADNQKISEHEADNRKISEPEADNQTMNGHEMSGAETNNQESSLSNTSGDKTTAAINDTQNAAGEKAAIITKKHKRKTYIQLPWK